MDLRHHSFNMPVNVCGSRDGFFYLFWLERKKIEFTSDSQMIIIRYDDYDRSK